MKQLKILKNMTKPKIYATGNENLSGDFNISYYIIEKDDNFLEWLGTLLKEVLIINDGENQAKFIVKETNDEHENPTGKEIYLKDIRKMIDLHEHYGNKGDGVDLFYGKDRVYVTFRKSKSPCVYLGLNLKDLAKSP
ncbi:hypothetical protein J4461_01135 [Candidatus Pacearchaeota archaeon]|nr:hypothetical protein [Candidatus Pacearchaeota archaeon]